MILWSLLHSNYYDINVFICFWIHIQVSIMLFALHNRNIHSFSLHSIAFASSFFCYPSSISELLLQFCVLHLVNIELIPYALSFLMWYLLQLRLVFLLFFIFLLDTSLHFSNQLTEFNHYVITILSLPSSCIFGILMYLFHPTSYHF